MISITLLLEKETPVCIIEYSMHITPINIFNMTSFNKRIFTLASFTNVYIFLQVYLN